MVFFIVHKTLFRLLSIIFEKVVLFRRKVFHGRKISNKEIVCVGNISLGGTGKTELVSYLAKKYLNMGKRVYILTRGYKGRLKKGIVTNMEYRDYGDEPVMLFRRFGSEVAIIKSRRKYKALREIDFTEETVVIVDDGFQHLKLERKFDFVCVNALNPFGNGVVLPYGILREPVESLKYADAIVLVNSKLIKKPLLDELLKTLRAFKKDIFFLDYEIDSFYNLYDEIVTIEPEKKLFLFAGIGNPVGFIRLLRRAGHKIVGHKFFPDHYKYSRADILSVLKSAAQSDADFVMTTEKDVIRLKDMGEQGNIIYTKIRSNFRVRDADN